jgi:hypothetical protein
LGGVILEEVSEVISRNKVTDSGDFECCAEVALLYEGAEDETSDAAETVDGDSGHIFAW